MVEFSARLALHRLKGLPRPDVVIASSPHPFVAFNGHRFARRYGAKFIFEVRDLWPLTLLEVKHSAASVCPRMAWAEARLPQCDTVSLLGGLAIHGRPRPRREEICLHSQRHR
jgi:hypothetical protein